MQAFLKVSDKSYPLPKQFISCETIKNWLLDFPDETECYINWTFSSFFKETRKNMQILFNQLEAVDGKNLCEDQIILTEAIKLGEYLSLNVDFLIEKLANTLIKSTRFDLVKEIGIPTNCLVKFFHFIDLDILFDSFAEAFYPGELRSEIIEKLGKISGEKNFRSMNHYRTLIVKNVATRIKVLLTYHRNSIKEWVISKSKDSIVYLDPHGRLNVKNSEHHVCLNYFFPDRYRKIFWLNSYLPRKIFCLHSNFILEKTDGTICYCSLSGKLHDINMEDNLSLELVSTNQNDEHLILFSDKDGANVFYSMKRDKVKKLICPDYLKTVYIKNIAFSWNGFMITYIRDNSIHRVGVLITGQNIDDSAATLVRPYELEPNLVMKKEIHYLKGFSYILTENGQLFSIKDRTEDINHHDHKFVTDILSCENELVIITL